MKTGQCHCGNVTISIPESPKTLTSCNCSICSRYASLWGYYTEKQVVVTAGKCGLKSYAWGDEHIDFHHCKNCGCITHYTSRDISKSDRVGVNFRMFEPELLKDIPVRLFDGAQSWQYIDE